jgi:membrane fusion protein (multidrug efflux system)
MAPPFPRSSSRLDSEGRTLQPLITGVAMLLLAAWIVWLVGSRIAVYAVSESARIEVDRASFPVQAPVAGRIVASPMRMGQSVEAGDVLVELDVRAQNLGVSEERARLSGLGPQLARINAEIAEQEVRRRETQSASAATKAEGRARYDEAVAAAELAVDHEQRQAKLAAAGLIGPAELIRAQSESKQKRAAAETLRLAIERIDAEQSRHDTELRIEIERLQREAANVRAAMDTGAAAVERLQHEGELRRITAPITGTLAEVANLRVGGVLEPGNTVATIVPAGGLRVVAAFLPADAFGRIRPGQPARVRLDGFPFTQYGSLQAVVFSVASELRDGRVRVELSLNQATASVPLQHGLPGSVEVEVERLSPAAVLLRAAGRRLNSPARASTTSPPPS